MSDMSSDTNQSLHPQDEQMDIRLWEYLDGIATASERTVIEKLLEDNEAWKKRYAELLQLNQEISASGLEQPSMRFTRNVMEEIARLHITPAARSYINNRIIWGIGLFFILMLAGILVYGFGQMLSDPGDPGNISKNIPKLDFSKFFNNDIVNALMMVNVVIGLFLFDNYLSGKRKKFRKEA